MASTYTTNLGIEKPTTGEQAGTWGDTINNNTTLIEQAITGYDAVTMSDTDDTTITMPDGASGLARNMILRLTGTLTASRNLIVPAKTKLYLIWNDTAGGFSVLVKPSGGNPTTIGSGIRTWVFCDGSTGVYPTHNWCFGNIEGNAGTVTNGVYTTGAGIPYADPSWLGSLAATKLTGTVNEVNLPTISVAKGGTGADSAINARANLNVPSRTGEGASGTWGITATLATLATTALSATNAGTSGYFTAYLRSSVTGSDLTSGTAYWQKNNKIVNLRLPPALNVSGNYSTTYLYICGLPTDIRPDLASNSTQGQVIYVWNQGVYTAALAFIPDSASYIQLYGSVSGGYFGASGNNGLPQESICLTYCVSD